MALLDSSSWPVLPDMTKTGNDSVAKELLKLSSVRRMLKTSVKSISLNGKKMLTKMRLCTKQANDESK